MIIDTLKVPLPDDPTPNDAPPSYDTLIQFTPATRPILQDSKQSRFSDAPVASSSTSPPRPPLRTPGSSSPGASSSNSGPYPSISKGKGKINWFNFAASRTEKDVRNTVMGLVRDLVREHHSNAAAPAGILASCAAACEAHSLSMTKLLQEKSIEGHTPLYWAIVKRMPDEQLDEDTQIPDLLIALLSHSTPLIRDTIMDVRHACLITSDQRLFQRLRMSPEFAKVSGTDQMLLGVTMPHDEIDVEELPGDEGEFAVDFIIPNFQKRMMVTQQITLEFIARCRMWKLCFAIAKESHGAGPKAGSWTVTLALQDNSPPTWIDSHIIVQPEAPGPTSPPPSSPSEIQPSPLQSAASAFGFHPPAPKPKTRSPISVRLCSRDRLSAPSGHSIGTQIVVCLEDSPTAATLQYAGNPYIAADEKLRMRLEARLSMPADNDQCVIC